MQPAQALLYSCAGLLFLWALLDRRFVDGDGFPVTAFCLPIAAAIAFVVWGAGVMTRYRWFAFWAGIAIVGQAAMLQMIEAGSAIRYQHFVPLGELVAGPRRWFLVWLAVQMVLMVAGMLPVWSVLRTWLWRTFGAWRLPLVVASLALTSVAVSRDVPRYAAELVCATLIQLINLGTIVLAVRSLPVDALTAWRARLDQLLTNDDRFNARLDRFAIIASVWVLGVASLLAVVSYQRHPHIPDEVGYMYHARYFAEGLLTMPAPPVPEAFDLDLMTYEPGRWYSPVPPGWPAALAIGVFFGAAWLVNPVLGGINVLLAYLLLQSLYGVRRARLATLLLCLSPWYLLMAMNYMTHTFALTCALAAALALTRARRTGNASWGWAAGAAVGVASLTRPLDGLIVAGLLGVWALGFGGERLRLASIVGLVGGSIAVGALVLPYNRMLTGDAWASPLMAYFDRYYHPNINALGFGADRGLNWPIDPFPGHGVRDAVVNAMLNISSINTELFGWSTGSLLFIIPLLVSGRLARTDRMMLSVVAGVAGLYAFYWFSGGPDFGARYWYIAIVPCVALTVSGVQALKDTLSRVAEADFAESRAVAAVLLLSAISVATFLPWRAVDKYFHFRSMRPDVRVLAEQHHFGKSVVLVRGDRSPDYASAAVYNPIDLQANTTIYAWDKNPAVREAVIRAYSDRPVWLVDGPSVTHAGFRIAQGPLAPGAEEIRHASR